MGHLGLKYFNVGLVGRNIFLCGSEINSLGSKIVLRGSEIILRKGRCKPDNMLADKSDQHVGPVCFDKFLSNQHVF